MWPRNWARSPTRCEKKLPRLQANLEQGRAQKVAFSDARLSPPPRGSEAGTDPGLEALFEKVPLLGVIYHLRWSATRIFDTAPNRAAAAQALDAWIAEARETGLDWEPFITMLENHRNGILAYFD